MGKAVEKSIFDLGIDSESYVPKYRQVVNYLVQRIESGKLTIGSRIPSINDLSEEFYLSRDTVEKAYTYLRERNVIKSVKGKGYYISNTDLLSQINVCLIFNKISAYKKIIFNAIVQELGPHASVDLFVHHCNPTLFKNILMKKANEYNYFVVMPHFREITDDVINAIKLIPENQLIILDKKVPQLKNLKCGEVFQDFENNIFIALEKSLGILKKYKKLSLIFPTDELYPYPVEIVDGFKRFCHTYKIAHSVIDEFVAGKSIHEKKEAFIVIEENDLVGLIKESRLRNWTIGKDIGILSYNDTPLKEVLADGISVISTDFTAMGKQVARMILDKDFKKIENPFQLIKRKSL
jgi:DNA-binding transcriptional regulator YhcF (GntR family)